MLWYFDIIKWIHGGFMYQKRYTIYLIMTLVFIISLSTVIYYVKFLIEEFKFTSRKSIGRWQKNHDKKVVNIYVELIINQYTLFGGITMSLRHFGSDELSLSQVLNRKLWAGERWARSISEITRCRAVKIRCITINTNIQ